MRGSPPPSCAGDRKAPKRTLWVRAMKGVGLPQVQSGADRTQKGMSVSGVFPKNQRNKSYKSRLFPCRVSGMAFPSRNIASVAQDSCTSPDLCKFAWICAEVHRSEQTFLDPYRSACLCVCLRISEQIRASVSRSAQSCADLEQGICPQGIAQ